MTRFIKVLVLTGLSSVYLMQLIGCGFAGHGFSLIPNGLVPNPFRAVLGT